ncbi:MAG: type II secretion system F family protein [Campylobacterales bacterium]|nr:type II secretion system F family protein [Campylobacterales bacterium]
MNPRILYKALTPNKEPIDGVFEGNKSEFEHFIRQKKLLILSYKEEKKRLSKAKFSQDDFLTLVEELYYLTKAGMAIDAALKLLASTATKTSQISLLKRLLQTIKEGKQLSVALSESLKNEGLQVDALSIGFLATAEEVGDLSDGLLQLFEYLSFQKKIRSDIRQALSYPAFLLIMSLAVSLLIFFLIIPKFSTIFTPEEFAKLPALSYAMLSLGKTLNQYSVPILSGLFAFVGICIWYLKSRTINWMRLFYLIPGFNRLIVDLQLSIVYGALSTMIKGGLELDKALRQLQKITLLQEINHLITNALSELKRGVKLSSVFSLSSLIPPSDIALLHVGEHSASMSEVFGSLSLRHSDAFSRSVKRVLAILEPSVIVGLGLFIAMVVVSIMLAVMSISDVAG